MSKSTISTFKLFEMFPDNESARLYLERRLWPAGPVCPDCKSERISERAKRLGFYHCNACNFDFTVRTGTIFERSKVPLHKWVYAMYLLVTARKGISSMQLAKEIGVTQKTAWFMLGRLREACTAPDSIDKLKGVIEEEFFDCGWMREGGCSLAGSEECDFECPNRDSMIAELDRKAKRCKERLTVLMYIIPKKRAQCYRREVRNELRLWTLDHVSSGRQAV